MPKQIELTRGKFALVDDGDFDWLNQWKWYAMHGWGDDWYAARNYHDENGNRQTILMHRLILSADSGVYVDHISHDGLDNRRENLRIATNAENGRNARRSKNNTSGYKGVSWSKVGRKWIAQVRVDGGRLHLGYFDNVIDAARAYDRAAIAHHGEFASINFEEPKYA